MPGQDAILTLLLQNQQLIGELGQTVQKWVDATRRMDQAADQVTFDAAKREVDALRQKIEALAVTSVKDLARIDEANKRMAEQFGASAANVKKVETAITQFSARAVKDLNRVQAEAEKLNLKKAQDQAKLVGKSYEELEASVRKSFIAARKAAEELNLQKVRDQAKLTAQSYQELEASVRKSFIEARKEAEKLSLQKAREEAERTKEAINVLASSAASHFRAMESAAKASGAQIGVGIGGQITALSPRLQSLRTQFDATIDAMRSASDKVTFERLRTQAQSLHDEIQRLGIEASNDVRKIGKAAEETSKPVANLSNVVRGLRNVLGALGIALSARSLFQFGLDAVQAGIRVQALEAQLSAASGSQKRYNEILAFSHESAERLGFDFEVLAQSTARFEAATRLAGISEEERLNALRATVEVARVLQLSNQRLNNTLLALEQIASKGTISLEELRRQLGDNVPGAVQILADQLDVTIPKLFKMIEANQVLSDVAIPALARGFDELSGPGLATALDTTATAVGQVRKEVLDLQVAFAEGFSEELRKGIRDTKQAIEEIQPAAFRAGEGVAYLIDQIAKIVASRERHSTVVREEGAATHFLLSLLSLVSDEYKDSSGNIHRYSEDIESLSENVDEKLNKSLETLAGQLSKVSAAGEDSAKKTEALAAASSSLVESVGQAQRAGKLQGDQLLELVRTAGQLSDLYGEDLPPNIGRLISSLEELLTVEQKAILAAERHAEAQKSEAEAALDAAEAFAKRSVAADEAAASLFGDAAALEKHTQATIDAIRNVIGSGEDLTSFTEEQLGVMRDAIQDLLEQWAKIGTEPPKALVFLGQQLEITTEVVEKELEDQSKSVEKAAKGQQKHYEDIRKSIANIGQELTKLSDQLDEGTDTSSVDDLKEKLRDLQDQEFEFIGDPSDLQEIREEIEQTRDELGLAVKAQQEVGAAGVEMADKIDEALKRILKDIAPVFGELSSAGQNSIELILQRLQDFGINGEATRDDVVGALRSIITEFESAGLPVDDLRSALNELSTGAFDLRGAFDELRRGSEQSGQALDDVRAKTEDVKDANKELFTEVAKGKALYKEFADAADSELKRAATAYDALLTRQERSLELCAALKNCLAGAG